MKKIIIINFGKYKNIVKERKEIRVWYMYCKDYIVY